MGMHHRHSHSSCRHPVRARSGPGAAWLLALLLAAPLAAPAAETYRLQPLEILPEQSQAVFARDVNDAGQVVGDARTRIGTRGFRWSPEQGTRDLGSIDGGPVRTTAQAIDGEGRVTGSSALEERFRPDHAVLWARPGDAQDLGDLGAGLHYSRGRALSTAGVVGSAGDGGAERPFIWREGSGLTPLRGADDSPLAGRALDINESGTIVGYSLGDGGPRPLRGSADGGLERLPLDGARAGRAVAVAADGRTVGVLQGDGLEAVLWDGEGRLERLGTPGAEPRDIGAGVVVGRRLDAAGASAFVWSRRDGLHRLTDLIAAEDRRPGLRLYSAEAVNGHGEIVAYGREADDARVRSYLLVPVDE